MSPTDHDTPSSGPAIGCSLVVMGLVGGGFGLAALSGLADHVELEFFGIELNDTRGRVIWTVGCLGLAAVGRIVMRATRRKV